jgi:NAD(P)-dependent dehydrogenase (short-subunit alcohol dehydrogenase family)
MQTIAETSMQGRLRDRVAVVTGGAVGIGKAIVERFCSEGAKVLAVDKDEARLDDLKKVNSGSVSTFTADVIDADAPRLASAQAIIGERGNAS